jgi:hypothetical protein
MSNWTYTLNFRDLITDEPLNEDQSIIRAKSMAKRLSSFINGFDDKDDDYMVYELWDVYELLNNSISVDEINEGLDALYDVADTYRIWVK